MTMNSHLVVFLDIFGLIMTLFSYAILADSYMIPSLSYISINYSLSQQVTGFLLAIGASTPEFTTNLISSIQGKSEDVALGLGAITGSGSFDFTVCFAIASLFTVGKGLQFSKFYYYRDALIYFCTALLLMIFLFDNKIYLYEAIILSSLWPVYIIINVCFFKENHPELKSEKEKLLSNEQTDEVIADQTKKENINLINFSNENATVLNEEKRDLKNVYNQINENSEKNQDEVNEEFLNRDDDEAQLLDSKKILEKINDNEKSQESEKEPLELGKKNIVVQAIELLAKLIGGIYYYVLPKVEKYPFICFILTLVLAFFHSKFIVSLVEDVSNRTGISASFFGITLISWAGNVGDSINASTATKAKKVDLLTTGILASQIMNLQLCLGLPWIIAMINNKIKNKGEMVIDFGKENVNKLFLPLLCVVLMSVFIIIIFSRVLNRKSGFWLMMIYVVYFVYESIHSKKSE